MLDNKFREAFVYKISSESLGKCYIGWTTQSENRIKSQLRNYKDTKNLGANVITSQEDAQFEKLETFNDISLEELRRKAGTYQKENNETSTNLIRAGRNKEERKEKVRQQRRERRRDTNVVYRANRNLNLRNMKLRGLPPRRKTIEKYNITQEEIEECCKRD